MQGPAIFDNTVSSHRFLTEFRLRRKPTRAEVRLVESFARDAARRAFGEVEVRFLRRGVCVGMLTEAARAPPSALVDCLVDCPEIVVEIDVSGLAPHEGPRVGGGGCTIS